MKTGSIATLFVATAQFVLLISNTYGQATLVDEDWQSPIFDNNQSRSSGDFNGWTFNNQWAYSFREDGNGSVPGDSAVTPNQVISLVYNSAHPEFDISHNWSSSDVYYLRVEASPSSWNGHVQRYIRPELHQQDGTVLWSTSEDASTAVPLYDNFGAMTDYPSELTFFFMIDASAFTETEGAPIRLRIDSSGQRGLYINNVTLTLGPLSVDNVAPDPDPLIWEIEPTISDFVNISMKADSARDPDDLYGVEYYFENTVAGTNSGWRDSRIWSESDLAYDTLYTYRFKVRDKSPNQNETAWSPEVSITTDPRDMVPPTPDPLTWEVMPVVGDYGTISMTANAANDPAGVQYYFENTVKGTNSGWQDKNTWTDGGLDHDTLFTYRVKARDKSPDQNESTNWSSEESAKTPSVPGGTLLITGFQSPLLPSGTRNPDFPGWTLFNAGSVKSRLQGSDGLPGDSSVTGSNQGIQFEWNNAELQHDISHNWSSKDIYILTLNAAPQDWGKANQRYIRPTIRQQDGTVLWDPGENLNGPYKTALPVGVSFGGSMWQDEPDLNFTFKIDASTFTAGTEGQPIALRLDSSGGRGLFLDNVSLSIGGPDDADNTVSVSEFAGTLGFDPNGGLGETRGLVTGSFAGYTGGSYTVQWSPDLVTAFVPIPGTNWPVSGTGSSGSDGVQILWSYATSDTSAFFRLVIE